MISQKSDHMTKNNTAILYFKNVCSSSESYGTKNAMDFLAQERKLDFFFSL